MKKTLLLATAAVAMASGASAKFDAPERIMERMLAPASTSEAPAKIQAKDGVSSLQFGYSWGFESEYSLRDVNSGYVYLAVEIPVADQAPFIGCQITGMTAISPMAQTNSNVNPISRGQGFVTDDLSVLPSFTTVDLSNKGGDINEITFTEPFTITGEKDIYFGYRFSLSTPCYYIPVDVVPTNQNTCLVAVTNKAKDVPEYGNYADQIGSLSISCTITGNVPENLGRIGMLDIAPVVEQGVYSYGVTLTNVGVKTINNVTIKTKAGNAEQDVVVNLPQPLATGKRSEIVVSGINTPAPGLYTMTSSLIAVNGTPVNGGELSGALATFDNGVERTLVIEEGTGTWCGWCPAGIVMMEYLKEEFPDWIRIAVHQGDRMALTSYQPFISAYISGFPSALTNRMIDTAPQYMYQNNGEKFYGDVYQYLKSIPTYATLDIQATLPDEKRVSVDVTSEFLFNTDVPHGVVVLTTEDGVGPYDQTNYFSPAYGQGINMEPWSSSSESVSTMFDDVVRSSNDCLGDASAFPAEIQAETPYVYNSVQNISKIKAPRFGVVAMIVNKNTGEVVQAKQIMVDNPSAVNEIENVAETGEAEYYSLDGRKVNASSLESGIYVKVQNGKANKIAVK